MKRGPGRKTSREVLEYVRASRRSGVTAMDVAGALGVTRPWADRVLSRLLELGSVRRVQIRRDGRLDWLYLPAG